MCGGRRNRMTTLVFPNVVFRTERRPVDFEITHALAELTQFAAERPQGTTSAPFDAELGRVDVRRLRPVLGR